jgi:ABC-type transport system involved in cytochrome c biogenesis permease subunit
MMPLGSQVTGAWLIAFGVAAALAIRERDLSRLRVPAVACTGFGLLELAVLFGYRDEVDGGDPWLWGYVALLVTAVLTGGYGWRAAHRVRTARS